MKDKEFKSENEVLNKWIKQFLEKHKMPEVTQEEIEAEYEHK